MTDRRTKGGHLSGDTPVSELTVPEVLFKPAMGTPAVPPKPNPAAVARFVAQSWRDAIRADGIQPLNVLAAVVLDKVLAAFDGETSRATLGITDDEDWPFGGRAVADA